MIRRLCHANQAGLVSTLLSASHALLEEMWTTRNAFDFRVPQYAYQEYQLPELIFIAICFALRRMVLSRASSCECGLEAQRLEFPRFDQRSNGYYGENVVFFSDNLFGSRGPEAALLELERPKRYLLRLIKTSFLTMFVFSIDNHLLQVISAYFVPIVPYYTRTSNVAISQRYNMVVEADQWNSTETNFWMRTWANTACGDAVKPLPTKPPDSTTYAQTGIIRYNESNTADPTSTPWPVKFEIIDEPYDSLVPICPWCVGSANNGDLKGEQMNITGLGSKQENHYATAFFTLTKAYPDSSTQYSFQINYSDPTPLDMWRDGPWKDTAVVIPEDYTENDWVGHN